MIEHEPATVESRNRLYTSHNQRRRIDTIDAPYGRGTPVHVGIATVDRDPSWGNYYEAATFETSLAYYGEIHVPREVADRLGLLEGDTVRLTIQRLS